MDTTLVTVTILSMGMAAALSVIVWRLLRDERRRSEARVAALTEAARTIDGAIVAPVRHAPAPKRDAVPVRDAIPTRDASGPSERPRVDGPGLSERPRVEGRRSSADDLPLHAGSTPVTTSALFAEPDRSSPWGSRFAVMAGLAMVGATIVLVAMTAARTRATAPPRSANAAPATQAPAEPAAPGLELMSLRDARQADTLTITGIVQNPRTGRLLSRVAVTAYAFDDKGTFLASGRALIDVTSLAPGDDSPFLVTVPVTEAVARYRIGFRSEDGRVIAHVDKRQQAPMAALRPQDGE
jgi:hypothetical protein